MEEELDQIEEDMANFRNEFENRKVAAFLVEEAVRFIELGELDAARECIREALVRHPGHGQALKLLADLARTASKNDSLREK